MVKGTITKASKENKIPRTSPDFAEQATLGQNIEHQMGLSQEQ